MSHTAFYAGSFDPVTNGHVDMIEAACRLCDRLILAIGVHPGKTPIFTAEERAALLREICGPIATVSGTELEVVTFDDLTIDAARRLGATILVRGLRDGTDLDYEMQLAGMNHTMVPELQTVFLPATPPARHITATLVRQVAAMGGDVSAFVPPIVSDRLQAKFTKR
ncbi:pantetheine-phosphate adenylyltransferase [Boseaceae bacterium BT-24-1]|nr:pantetheine-phosphate adenylyltransferase [Boseaceae bacterium BT-24-1]